MSMPSIRIHHREKTVLHADHLQKRFSAVHAVDDLSLHAEGGEIFGLLGPNGAGKSTTIRMIVDIIRPDSGTIRFDGRPFDDAVRNALGYLPEERGLYQKAGVMETIVHFGRLKGLDRATAERRAAEWLDRFDLSGRATRKVEELSKGNQQKVQIIIALLHDPRILILDEPTSGLDPVNQEIFRDILLRERAAGKIILYSTHQLDLAERMCDRIALIDKGRVVLHGTVDEVRRERGENRVAIDFTGDGAFLRDLPGVVAVEFVTEGAVVTLTPEGRVDDLLPALAGRIAGVGIALTRIERIRPTLNDIFLATVRAAKGNDDTASSLIERPEDHR